MHQAVETRVDRQRGCGWRKAGGLYLVSHGTMRPCGKLPVALPVCPTCSGGIKFSRSWTWIDVDVLLKDAACKTLACGECPLSRPMGRAGLLWIGEKFYKEPRDWLVEAAHQGVSRRIPTLPKHFVIGQTWVLVAHRKAVTKACEAASPHDDCHVCGGTGEVHEPGIFHAFKPTAVEYVVRGDESDEEIERKVQRGITPVRVQRAEEQAPLIDEALEAEVVEE